MDRGKSRSICTGNRELVNTMADVACYPPWNFARSVRTWSEQYKQTELDKASGAPDPARSRCGHPFIYSRSRTARARRGRGRGRPFPYLDRAKAKGPVGRSCQIPERRRRRKQTKAGGPSYGLARDCVYVALSQWPVQKYVVLSAVTVTNPIPLHKKKLITIIIKY